MGRLGYLFMALVIAAFPLVVENTFYLHLAQTLAYTAIAVIGLNLLLGLSGQMSLGQAGFYAIGAYATAILSTRYGWPLYLTIPLAIVCAGVAGAVVGLVALRTRGLYLAMATLAFGFIVEILAQRWIELTGGTMGLIGVPFLDFGDMMNGARYFFWTVGAAYLVVQILSDHVFQSRWGRNLLAVKESESFARTVGLDVPLWRTGVFVVSALLAGASGALFTHQSGFLSSDAFTIRLTLGLLIATVIGGLGRSYGPVLGTAILLAIDEGTAGLHDIGLMLYGAILLAVLIGFPEGATGLVRRLLPGRLLSRSPRVSGRQGRPQAQPAAGSRVGHRQPVGLTVEAVTKAYAGVVAAKSVSLTVEPGTVHALIGPNGAGKSTTINVIAGLYQADSGRIAIGGRDVTALPAHRRARLGLARTFQNLQLIASLDVLDNVLLGRQQPRSAVGEFVRWLADPDFEEAERGRARAALDFFGIGHLAEAYPADLSYGHRKLCELARAVAQEPAVMLLDEPVAGINAQEAAGIAEAVRRLRDAGISVLLVEHNMDFVMGLSDRITVLDYGEVIATGTPDEIRRDRRVIDAYLGSEEAAQ